MKIHRACWGVAALIAIAIACACGSSSSSTDTPGQGPDAGDDMRGDDGSAPGDAGDAGPPDLPASPYATDLGLAEVWGVGVSSKGETFVAAELGVIPSSEEALLMAKLDALGNPLWKKQIGGEPSTSSYALAVAVDGSDNAVFAGFSYGVEDFGGGTMSSGTYVAKYTSDGALVFVNAYGRAAAINAVATAKSGDIYVCGELEGDADFGGGMQHTVDWNTFFIHLDASGKYVGSKVYGGGDIYCNGVDVDASGNILLSGFFNGSADFGGPTALNGPPFRTGVQAGFVAKLDPNGGYIAAKNFTGTVFDSAVFDSKGNVLLGASFEDAVDFGGGMMMSAGFGDIAVAKLDPMLGYVWAKRFGDKLDQGVGKVARDFDDGVVVTGAASGQVDFGKGPIGTGDASSGTAAYVLRLDASGSTRAVAFDETGGVSGSHQAVAVSHAEAVAGGFFRSSLTLGVATFTNDGGQSGFVARFAP
ncbi:MAG TPA: hypothetical protein VIF62_36620 [Labilithrix sp.]